VEAAHRVTLPRNERLDGIAGAAAALPPEGSSAMAYALDASKPSAGVMIDDHSRHGVEPSQQRFVAPSGPDGDAIPHYGRPGGVLPTPVE
jgi:hypothetical protein